MGNSAKPKPANGKSSRVSTWPPPIHGAGCGCKECLLEYKKLSAKPR
jgi:hypothetical protein